MNRTLNQPFEDGAHILYVNGEYRDDSDIGRLMHDFCCTKAEDMNFELMAERTRYLKEDPKGVSEICKVMEDLRVESREEGRVKQAQMTAKNLYMQGQSVSALKRSNSGVPLRRSDLPMFWYGSRFLFVRDRDFCVNGLQNRA